MLMKLYNEEFLFISKNIFLSNINSTMYLIYKVMASLEENKTI